MTQPEIQQLTPGMFDALRSFWETAFPEYRMPDAFLRERVFAPNARPENSLCMLDEEGRIVALALLVKPGVVDKLTGERVGGIRWFGVHPDRRNSGMGSHLLEAACDWMEERGATAVDYLATPPFYVLPGVDIRHTEVIAWLLRRGFERHRINFNMTVNLNELDFPPESEIYGADGEDYRIRRAEESDREELAEFFERHWTQNWQGEALLGLQHDPVSLFIAETGGGGARKIVGFSVYETSQLPGTFGPMGVNEEYRMSGLGRRVLLAALGDMKRLGRRVCEIGWVGPVDFYYRTVGARLGPVFWQMRRPLVHD